MLHLAKKQQIIQLLPLDYFKNYKMKLHQRSKKQKDNFQNQKKKEI